MNVQNTDTEAVTASQLRHRFEELVGAGKGTRLWLVLDQVIVAAQDERAAEIHEDVALLARHFPSLETAMSLVWAHIQRSDPARPCDACRAAPVATDDAS